MENRVESTYQTQMIEEDEIDLRELFATIMRGKKIIIIFTLAVIAITFIYVLKLPNIYKSEAILIPTENKSGGLGSLGGLAAMAGVSVGGGSMTPDVAFNSLLNNYAFMRTFVIRNKMVEYYSQYNVDENYVFALGYRGVYEFFKAENNEDEIKNKDDTIYSIIKKIRSGITISSDKKTALITVSYSDADRAYTPKVVEAFLKDASSYLVTNNLKNIDAKLKYFQTELTTADSIELRQNISTMISNIVQEKVMMKSKKYYQCDVLTQASPSYIKDKTKPKRGLILVVSAVTALILSIFLVFFLAFLKNDENTL